MTAAATTWGMSSTEFFLLYVVLCGAVWCANVLTWRWAAGRASDEVVLRELGLYELAMLNGGPSLAITTAAAALREQELLSESAVGAVLMAAGDTAEHAHPLERAVLDAVRLRPVVTADALARDPACRDATERLADAMTREGLLVAPDRARWARRLWLAGPWVLLATGAARLSHAWDYEGDEHMRYLFVVVIVTGFVAITHVLEALGSGALRLPTARGDALLAQRQSSGAGGLLQQSAGLVAPAVALAGAAELWKLDPTLAATLGIAREEPAKADGMWGGCGGCGGCG